MVVYAGRGSATRDRILSTAERLFAEHGVLAVSNRQISEAAGQGNNTAVGYHFGTKAGLVRAIVRRHALQIDGLRAWAVAEIGDSTDLRDWVGCWVRPFTDYLDGLGSPSWFARFNAQLMTEPAFHDIMVEEFLAIPSMVHAVDGLNRCLTHLPIEIRMERGDMARHLIVHMCAERERALAENTGTPRASWQDAATGLVDAIVAIWQAPVTASRRTARLSGPT